MQILIQTCHRRYSGELWSLLFSLVHRGPQEPEDLERMNGKLFREKLGEGRPLQALSLLNLNVNV